MTDSELIAEVEELMATMRRIGPWGYETEGLLELVPRLMELARDGLRWRNMPDWRRAWIEESANRPSVPGSFERAKGILRDDEIGGGDDDNPSRND